MISKYTRMEIVIHTPRISIKEKKAFLCTFNHTENPKKASGCVDYIIYSELHFVSLDGESRRFWLRIYLWDNPILLIRQQTSARFEDTLLLLLLLYRPNHSTFFIYVWFYFRRTTILVAQTLSLWHCSWKHNFVIQISCLSEVWILYIRPRGVRVVDNNLESNGAEFAGHFGLKDTDILWSWMKTCSTATTTAKR